MVQENSHDRPTGQTDDDHKCPAGKHGKERDGIRQWLVEPKLGKVAVKGVESSLVNGLLFIRLGGVNLDYVGGGCGAGVERNDMDR